MTNGPQKLSTRRCVVWHHPGVSVHKSLIGALGSRGLRVETSGSGHEVLAMACAVQQQLDGGTRGLIVVLDGNGQQLQDLGRVIESMDRYAPSALIWVFAASANPPLSGFVRTESGLVDTGPVQKAPVTRDVEVGVKIQSNLPELKFKTTQESTHQTTEQTTEQTKQKNMLEADQKSMHSPMGNTSGPVLRLSGGQQSGPKNGPKIVGPGINPVQASDVLNQDELSALLKPDDG